MVDRKQLDTIILTNGGDNWWKPELFIKHTRDELPPELEILENPPPEDQNYNCFIYVLGLQNDRKVRQETNGFIYDSFIKHLLDIGEMQTTDTPTTGDYIVYQDLEHYPENLTHIGVLEHDKVVSKWAWGPRIKHNIWDVPAEYGNDIFYIRSVPPAHAHRLYEKYKKFNIKPQYDKT